MLRDLFSRAKMLFLKLTETEVKSGIPVWGDGKHLESIWDEGGHWVISYLGTRRDAIETLNECEAVFEGKMECAYFPFRKERFCIDTDNLRDRLGTASHIVGDTRDVGTIFGRRLSVGYVVKLKPSAGLQKEVIESREKGITILRKHGRIVSAHAYTMDRHETKAPALSS